MYKKTHASHFSKVKDRLLHHLASLVIFEKNPGLYLSAGHKHGQRQSKGDESDHDEFCVHTERPLDSTEEKTCEGSQADWQASSKDTAAGCNNKKF
ncbi:hypothetical protein AVEN_32330-1 [Araneus ventricosus]|uniref:Uncharacterized protein n=1 Tax=Araneus ventricosus TaxID=182803 RepID=A0A4Y2FM38_ARAVE|nr:hypothetical protein AVEN_32330-1 [Araneus ventricosus]